MKHPDPDPITAWLTAPPSPRAFRKPQIVLTEQDGAIVAACYPHGPGTPYEARGTLVADALRELARRMAADAETGLHRL